jgi:hypothetical protein
MILHQPTFCQYQEFSTIEDFAIAPFIRFLKQLNLKGMLSEISDLRQQNKSDYSHCTHLLWALSVFFFRQSSKNALQTTIESTKRQKRDALLKFMDIEEGKIPHRTTVDDYLAQVNPDEINDLLIKFFKQMQKKKVFYNHAETLLPSNTFLLCSDGLWVHKYDKPHAVDKCGNNICPYCLPRTHNKGTAEEKTYWVHAFVNFMFIFPCGLQIPIYVHPLKAVQAKILETDSDEKLKQECELQAFYDVLPLLKAKLNRIQITILADSLYSNEPVIQLCEELGWGYILVRQEESLKSVGRQCDDLAKTELYQKSYQAYQAINEGTKTKGRITQWFNRVAIGKESFTNVLRFQEISRNAEGEVIKKFKTEWLVDEKVHKGNCFKIAEQGRMRAGHEDLHNTLKNRGFAAKHDYARTNPNRWLLWKLLMFAAFAIFEMFSFTRLAREVKGSRSWMKFAKDLLQELVNVLWREINLSESIQKKKIQFRYEFEPG